jgi:hypothetical protein
VLCHVGQPGNTSPRGEKKTAGAKWRERIMQLRKNDGKIDKAKLRSGSMPNIRKGTHHFRATVVAFYSLSFFK